MDCLVFVCCDKCANMHCSHACVLCLVSARHVTCHVSARVLCLVSACHVTCHVSARVLCLVSARHVTCHVSAHVLCLVSARHVTCHVSAHVLCLVSARHVTCHVSARVLCLVCPVQWPAGWLRQCLVVRGSGWGAAGRGVRLLGNSAVEGLSPRQRKVIGGWLLGCCGMVAGAVILGECAHGCHVKCNAWQTTHVLMPPIVTNTTEHVCTVRTKI